MSDREDWVMRSGMAEITVVGRAYESGRHGKWVKLERHILPYSCSNILLCVDTTNYFA